VKAEEIGQYLSELNDELRAMDVKGDVELLIKFLGLKTPDEVFAILEKYYPRQRVKPATQFFIEELFGR
jgi:hypothetical protein